jgi:hypothetical protein
VSSDDPEYRWRLYDAEWALLHARRQLANDLEDARADRFYFSPLTGLTACALLYVALSHLRWLALDANPDRDEQADHRAQ